MMGFDGRIAFAGRLSQTGRAGNIDVTPAVTDHSLPLQRMGHDRNRVALHADQLGQRFLSQRQGLATAEIACAQQRQRCCHVRSSPLPPSVLRKGTP